MIQIIPGLIISKIYNVKNILFTFFTIFLNSYRLGGIYSAQFLGRQTWQVLNNASSDVASSTLPKSGGAIALPLSPFTYAPAIIF